MFHKFHSINELGGREVGERMRKMQDHVVHEKRADLGLSVFDVAATMRHKRCSDVDSSGFKAESVAIGRPWFG